MYDLFIKRSAVSTYKHMHLVFKNLCKNIIELKEIEMALQYLYLYFYIFAKNRQYAFSVNGLYLLLLYYGFLSSRFFFLVQLDGTGQYRDLSSRTHGIWDRIKHRGKRITVLVLISVVICGNKSYN
jgi:hypothetical protein